MKIGDTVEVFENPLTETKSMGKCVLVEFHGKHGVYNNRNIENWKVRFAREDGLFLYSILA